MPSDKGKTPLKRQWASKQEEETLRAKNLKILTKKPAVEKCLEDLVFGGQDEFVERLIGASKTEEEELSADVLGSDSDDEHPKTATKSSKKAAWVDEEDEQDESVEMTHRYRKDFMKSKAERTLSKEKLNSRLREEYQKAMGGVPSWASKSSKKKGTEDDDESEEEDDDNLLTRTGNFLTKSSSLEKGTLMLGKCLNANNERKSKALMSSVQFHPSAQVIMTASHDCSVSLFQVDGKINPKIQSIFLKNCPVYKAQFSVDGEQVIATGIRQKTFYVYDMMQGSILPLTGVRGVKEDGFRKFELSPDGSFLLFLGATGNLHLLSMKSKELIGSMKANGNPTSAVFSSDSSKIFSNSEDGEVYVWDVNSRRCVNRFYDDGSINGASMAVSKDGRYLSCGSNSGVVNIYNAEDCLQNRNPKPIKSIMNLVTSASTQVFNPQTEILAVASGKLDDAVKLVHIPSFTVFLNFPFQGKRKYIHRAMAMDFSPNSGYFSIANNKGEALLYRIKHYKDF